MVDPASVSGTLIKASPFVLDAISKLMDSGDVPKGALDPNKTSCINSFIFLLTKNGIDNKEMLDKKYKGDITEEHYIEFSIMINKDKREFIELAKELLYTKKKKKILGFIPWYEIIESLGKKGNQ